jgi:hypothetical protein
MPSTPVSESICLSPDASLEPLVLPRPDSFSDAMWLAFCTFVLAWWDHCLELRAAGVTYREWPTMVDGWRDASGRDLTTAVLAA